MYDKTLKFWKPYEKGKKMTNREWLNSLSDEELAEVILSISATPDLHSCSVCGYKYGTVGCGSGENCVKGFKLWLGYNHIEPKKELTQAQLCEAFEAKYGKRRAISLDEAKDIVKELFE